MSKDQEEIRQPVDGETITTCDYQIRWTSQHPRLQDLYKLIHSYDDLSTTAVEDLIKLGSSGEGKHGLNYFQLLKDNASHDGAIGELWKQVNTVPAWVDWAQIERGQKVYWRYAGATTTALTYLSLLGSFGYGRAVMILDRTGAWQTDRVRRRLLETAQHTLGVHKDLQSIQPGGEGWESSVRVRLLHTAVRRRIIALAHQNPSYYDLARDGVPINDLDCMITISDFCSQLVWMGLPRQGIHLRDDEILDFLALWRYVAYLMGSPHDFLQTPRSARAFMEAVLVSDIKPTRASAVISSNLISGLEGTPPTYASRGFMLALTYRLIGDTLASDLDLERPTAYYKVLVMIQCGLFQLMAGVQRTLWFWDDAFIEVIKKRLYQLILEDKEKGALGHKTTFAFKWVPSLDSRTTALVSATAEQKREQRPLRHPGPETTALMILLIAILVPLGTGLWASWRYLPLGEVVTTARGQLEHLTNWTRQ